MVEFFDNPKQLQSPFLWQTAVSLPALFASYTIVHFRINPTPTPTPTPEPEIPVATLFFYRPSLL